MLPRVKFVGLWTGRFQQLTPDMCWVVSVVSFFLRVWGDGCVALNPVRAVRQFWRKKGRGEVGWGLWRCSSMQTKEMTACALRPRMRADDLILTVWKGTSGATTQQRTRWLRTDAPELDMKGRQLRRQSAMWPCLFPRSVSVSAAFLCVCVAAVTTSGNASELLGMHAVLAC